MELFSHAGSTHSEKGFKPLWQKFFPYWPVFVLLITICVAAGWFYLQYKAPMYSARATILIRDKEKGYDDSKVVEDLNPLASKNSIENEMELLESRTMMAAVVRNLHLYASLYEDGVYGARSAYLTSPVIIMAKNPDSIVHATKVPFTFNKNNSSVTFGGRTYPLNEWVKTNYGTLQFQFNKLPIAGHSKQQLFFSLFNPDNIATDYASRLQLAFLSKGATVVDLSISDEVPQRAKDILDELIAVYNKAAIAEQNKLASNTLSFIDERLIYIVMDLDSIERKVQQYKAYQGAVDINQQGLIYLDNVNTNDRKIGEINTQLAVLDQLENYVLSKDTEGAIVPSSLGISNPAMSDLLSKLYTAQLQYAALKRTASRNNPVLSTIADQIDLIKPGLLENIRNQRKNLQVSRNNTITTNGSYSSMLRKIPTKERELIDISRQQNTKNNIYTFLLQKREETALSYASSLPESRVIDKAIASNHPQSPLPRNIYTIAVIIGTLLFIIWVYCKETLNNAILYRHEIEMVTSLPIIGEIVYEKLKKPIVISKDKQTVVSQQFHKLRASLNFLGINNKRKKILVASFISGEGKSFIAANLGVSLALTGKKVVLLELDLLKPTLCDKFNIYGNKGITDYLLDEALIPEIILQTEAHENLFLIPSGELNNNSSELIMNGKIQLLLNDLERMFDFIIVDTAPVGPTTDAYSLSSLCDASLFVIRHDYTPKALVKRIDEENIINPLKNAAIVFNGVKSRGFTKNNYGVGYGYGYAYAYNEKKNTNKTKQLVIPGNG